MKKLWELLGRISYWAGLPFLYLKLRFTKRTRVLIRCGDELLMVKGWLGSGNWQFPGGGLHRGEAATNGAIREVHEETGISLRASQLTFLFEGPTVNPQGLRYHCIVFGAELKTKPPLKQASGELTALAWVGLDELKSYADAGRILIPALTAWDSKK